MGKVKSAKQIRTMIRHLEHEMRLALQDVMCLQDEERIRNHYEPKILSLKSRLVDDDELPREFRNKRRQLQYG